MFIISATKNQRRFAMVFYLVRHGQTDWNNERRIQGHSDVPMNETGYKQIHDLADKMAKEKLHFDRIISSPLSRARITAGIIAEKVGYDKEIIVDDLFIERYCGNLEGVLWYPGLNLDDPKYGMESYDQVSERVKKAIDGYNFSKDEKVMIASHGGTLTALRTVLSDYKIGYSDPEAPIIQGNVLCCIKEEGKETQFSNLF